jgi:outer membrane protein assembly factor BamB
VPMYTSHAFSPMIDRGVVIFHVGGHDKGALTAFDLNTGDVKWSWAGDGPGYGSPIVADFGGVRQLVTITQGKLVGIDLSNGALLWEQPYVSSNFTNSITPVRFGDTVIAWGPSNTAPMTALRVARQSNKWMVAPAWENADVPGRMSNAVLDGEVLFGLTSRNMGQYFALDAKTGKTLWTSEGRQAANVALARAGNVLIGLENDGELVVFRASRTGFELIRRYRVAGEEMFSTWAQPALSGNRIFVKDASTLALWTLN